jgi:23S rRNA pseudouridine1911/1915/1917 synthase
VANLRAFKRQALHAASLAFDLPRTGKRKTLRSPLPADFRGLLAALRKDARLLEREA